MEPKTFEIKAVLLNFGSFEVPTKMGINVHVYNEEKKLIGFSSIKRINNKIIADISIDYNTPERLLIETKEIELWARPIGHFLGSSKYLELVPEKIIITGIVISMDQPHDKSIPPLGEPIL